MAQIDGPETRLGCGCVLLFKFECIIMNIVLEKYLYLNE